MAATKKILPATKRIAFAIALACVLHSTQAQVTRDTVFECPIRPGALCVEANLPGAKLAGADLRMADFSRANLRGADLSGANLRDADMERVDLRGANLSGADLSDTDLANADLRDADLRGATLAGTDLRDADLRGARFDREALKDAYTRGCAGCGSSQR